MDRSFYYLQFVFLKRLAILKMAGIIKKEVRLQLRQLDSTKKNKPAAAGLFFLWAISF